MVNYTRNQQIAIEVLRKSLSRNGHYKKGRWISCQRHHFTIEIFSSFKEIFLIKYLYFNNHIDFYWIFYFHHAKVLAEISIALFSTTFPRTDRGRVQCVSHVLSQHRGHFKWANRTLRIFKMSESPAIFVWLHTNIL